MYGAHEHRLLNLRHTCTKLSLECDSNTVKTSTSNAMWLLDSCLRKVLTAFEVLYPLDCTYKVIRMFRMLLDCSFDIRMAV